MEVVLLHVLGLSAVPGHPDLWVRLDSQVSELSEFEGRNERCCLPCQDTLSLGCSPPHSDPCRSQTFAEVAAVSHSFQAHVELLPAALWEVCAGLDDDLPPHPQSDSGAASPVGDALHHHHHHEHHHHEHHHHEHHLARSSARSILPHLLFDCPLSRSAHCCYACSSSDCCDSDQTLCCFALPGLFDLLAAEVRNSLWVRSSSSTFHSLAQTTLSLRPRRDR